jgi:hypothetical protein
MSTIDVPVTVRGFGSTTRRDLWWVQPLLTFLGLGTFVVYATWAALQGDHYRFGPYLSPFYSPELFGDPEHAWFGGKPGWFPSILPFSAALFILWAPGLFRVTCYYYRGAYYKAFWADPPSCAVGEPRKSYCGEASFPLIVQNIHRYFLYVAFPIWMVLVYDVWKAMWFPDRSGQTHFGIGIGTLVLLLNVVFLYLYCTGCHSLRHLIGGRVDELCKSPVRKQAYSFVSCLNRRHMVWAWASLFSVGFADLYVRMCSMGVWNDWRIL